MDVKKENDLLEETLSIAETDYAQAYRFLLAAYEKEPGGFGPQTLYFLACLAGGAGMQDAALGWLRTAIEKNGWWYRPEVLVDDDLAQLEGSPEFLALKARSDARYADAVSAAKSVFSWDAKKAARLFLAVHGNTQNAKTAQSEWAPILAGDDRWQLETIQSAEPDGYGTFRWSYDDTSFLPVANALDAMQGKEFATELIAQGADVFFGDASAVDSGAREAIDAANAAAGEIKIFDIGQPADILGQNECIICSQVTDNSAMVAASMEAVEAGTFGGEVLYGTLQNGTLSAGALSDLVPADVQEKYLSYIEEMKNDTFMK